MIRKVTESEFIFGDSNLYDCKEDMGELEVPSSSSTQIIDGDDVRALQTFKSALRDLNQVNLNTIHKVPTVNTLAELLEWGHDRKRNLFPDEEMILFKTTIEMVDVRIRNEWYLITCTMACVGRA
uniref:uncharacterized protein LOC122601680 n=1 Tax=Erigeron canadensis TaxID=72917 RepID=UPI001CB9B614|nr:uncharacterized protein LOC122601680 [Erigeron canadensis]